MVYSCIQVIKLYNAVYVYSSMVKGRGRGCCRKPTTHLVPHKNGCSQARSSHSSGAFYTLWRGWTGPFSCAVKSQNILQVPQWNLRLATRSSAHRASPAGPIPRRSESERLEQKLFSSINKGLIRASNAANSCHKKMLYYAGHPASQLLATQIDLFALKSYVFCDRWMDRSQKGVNKVCDHIVKTNAWSPVLVQQAII